MEFSKNMSQIAFKTFLFSFLFIFLFSKNLQAVATVNNWTEFASAYNDSSAGAENIISIGNDIDFSALGLAGPSNRNLSLIEGNGHIIDGTAAGVNANFNIDARQSLTFRNILFRNMQRTAIDGGSFLLFSANAIFESAASNTLEFRNNAAKNGGAIFATAATTISKVFFYARGGGGGIIFANNAVSEYGGAIYASNSDIEMKIEQNSSITFTNNRAGARTNDIYLGAKTSLKFDIDNGGKAELSGGLQGVEESNVIKSGQGSLIIGGYTDYKGRIEIANGSFTLISNNMKIGSLTLGAETTSAELALSLESSAWINSRDLYIGSLNINKGILTASDINYSALYEGYKMPIIRYDSISGSFDNTGGRSGEWRYVILYDSPNWIYLNFTSNTMLDISGLNYNQNEVQRVLNSLPNDSPVKQISEVLLDHYPNNPEVLTHLSGSFLIDALRSAAINNNASAVYNRIEKIDGNGLDNKLPLWVELNIKGMKLSDEELLPDFNASGIGFLAGAQIYNDYDKSLGGYLGYSKTSLKWSDDSGSVGDIEFGLFGALYDLYEKKLNLKGNFGLSILSFNTERNFSNLNYLRNLGEKSNASFNAFKINAGAQAQYLAREIEGIFIEPFLGLDNSLIINPSIKEQNGGELDLSVEADAYLRMQSVLGVKAYGSKDKLSWNGKWNLGFLLAGSKPKYDISFSGAKNAVMAIYGSDEGIISMGIGAGAQYQIKDTAAVFASIDANFGANSSFYFVSLGVHFQAPQFVKVDRTPQQRQTEIVEKQQSQTAEPLEEKAKIESVENASEEEKIDEQEFMRIDRDGDLTQETLEQKKTEAIGRRSGVIIKSFI
ncbi:MAG: autotransporter domain-containing protein, partial [Elusimicrobiota bacterium]|nr:autotransporter domain-containing protein [Elusimicrobiota bacterium]